MTRKKAERMVRDGMALLSECGRRLTFLIVRHGVVARPLADAEIDRLNRAALQNAGYDSRGILRLKEIARVPVVAPVKLITLPTKARGFARRNGKTKLIVVNGKPQAAA